jgi:hypothetical protein
MVHELHQKFIIIETVKKFPSFEEPKISLQYSEKSNVGYNLKSVQLVSNYTPYSSKIP